MASECTSPNTVQGRSCCCATAGRRPGTRGDTSFAPSARPATTRWRPTSAATVAPTARRRSISTHCSTWSARSAGRSRPGSARRPSSSAPLGGGLLSAAVDPAPLPGWLTEADVDVYTREFERTGFRGGLNWYRNIDRNWELLAPFSGARVTVPALFIAGDRDPVLSFPGSQAALDGMATLVPNLRKTLILEGCGHWTQQERPAEVNTAMLEFLRSL